MASDLLFIKVHNGFPEHPKTGDLSDRAFRNLIELWCYCSRNLTDGFVKNAQANKILSPKSRRELVVTGFMIEHLDAVEMHDYLEHQQSAQQVADLRHRRAEAGSKGGKAKANRLASARAKAKQTPSKPVADTDTDTDIDTPDADASGSAQGAGNLKRATQRPSDFQPSQAHVDLAAELGVDLQSEWQQFCDHHDAKGSTYKDWSAALRTWLRNAKKFGRAASQSRSDGFLAAARRLHDRDQQHLEIGDAS
jgi:hypothetical protein